MRGCESQGGGEASARSLGRSPRPKGVLEEGACSDFPPHQLECLRSAVSSPSRVRGGASENLKFGAT